MLVTVLLCYTASATSHSRASTQTKWLAGSLVVLILAQLTAGIANLLLHAPTWLQLIHLLLADLNWIALIMLTASALSQQQRAALAPAVSAPVAA